MFSLTPESYQQIKTVTELQAVSSNEDQVREYMRQEMVDYVDFIEEDGLGGIFGVIEAEDPNAPTVMLAAHMDEIGFMVKNITKDGFLQVVALGGWNPHVVSAQRFTLQMRDGETPVISSSIPPHLLKGKEAKDVDLEKLLFDAGFESKEEAIAFGVRPGDTIVPDVDMIETANVNRFITKAYDNRYGVALVLEVVKEIKDKKLPFHLVIGANSQEEVGLRGAKASTNSFEPDVFFAVDCSPAGDAPKTEDSMGEIGKGFLLRIQDPGMITRKGMRYFIEDLAEANEIPYQPFFSKGGTDAVAAHTSNGGIATAVIGVAARYIHTHQTLFDGRDFEAAKAIVLKIIETLDEEQIKSIYAGY